jgi:hypothetical protein
VQMIPRCSLTAVIIKASFGIATRTHKIGMSAFGTINKYR